jgi:hypothetical protein
MSGVIDERGVQWEHCNVCTQFKRIESLGYLPPNTTHPHGADICVDCANKLPQELLDSVVPAASWIPQYVGDL